MTSGKARAWLGFWVELGSTCNKEIYIYQPQAIISNLMEKDSVIESNCLA